VTGGLGIVFLLTSFVSVKFILQLAAAILVGFALHFQALEFVIPAY
jgi:hypothetical protein